MVVENRRYVILIICGNLRIWTGIEEVITALTRNQVVAQAARGFESHPVRQIGHKPHSYAVCVFLYTFFIFFTSKSPAESTNIGGTYILLCLFFGAYFIQYFERAFFLARVEVRIYIPGNLNIAMPEAARDFLYIYPLIRKQ